MDGVGLCPTTDDSGAEWLRDLPPHWGVERIKNVVSVLSSNVDKHSREGEHPVRLCNYADVYYNARIHSDLDFMKATATKKEIERFRLVADDVLITKDSEAWDDIGVPSLVGETSGNVICGYHLALLRPINRVLGQYLYWSLLCREVAIQLHVRANGVTRFGLSLGAVASVRMPVPPMAEQAMIARSLDHVTSKIDAYIGGKEKLIALLEEQQRTTISEAVTGQIDVETGQPYPSHRLSGHDWLRRMPSHWETRRSKRVFRPQLELARPNDVQLSATQAWGVIAQADFEERVGRKVVRISQHLDKRRHVEIDDFVISMRSFQGGLERAWARGCIRSSYVVLRATTEISCDYFGFLFKSTGYINALRSTADFIRDGQDLNFDNFCRVDLPFPPLDEQRRIGKALNKRIEAISRAIEKSRQEMALLSEFRQRLVADMVTGRIDVRQVPSDLRTEVSFANRTDVSSSKDAQNSLGTQRGIAVEATS